MWGLVERVWMDLWGGGRKFAGGKLLESVQLSVSKAEIEKILQIYMIKYMYICKHKPHDTVKMFL